MPVSSAINRMLTLDYILHEKENKYFDCKSAQIKPSDLAPLISAFANADGGTIVIGVSNTTRTLEGINFVGQDRINDFISAPKDFCRPMPRYQKEFLDVVNINGAADRLLLLHIQESTGQIVRNIQERVWLRIADRTKELHGDDLKNLEYAKSTRSFEDEPNWDARIEDLDAELLDQYKAVIGAAEQSSLQVLRARGFVKRAQEKEYLSNAAVLLFAKNIAQFYPNCRVRFLRYDGTYAGVGTKINITRDKSIELPLLRIIEETKSFIATQLREFMMFDVSSGKFQSVPEYPEFAWLEGIVNAVTHREYAMSGSFIKVTMYDDRLEIESPGRLPNIVTIENIKETRYSRNPRISRVLTEFGWVRELNEGVNRIYQEMADFFLDEPVYTESKENVRLVLTNNILMRRRRQELHTIDHVGAPAWDGLDHIQQQLLTYIINHGPTRRSELSAYTKRSSGTILKRLNTLIDMELVKANGGKYDPNRTYEAILPKGNL